MKKINLVCFCVLLVAMALAGCTGGADSSESTPASDETATVQDESAPLKETTETPEPEPADAGEITVYTALEDEQVTEYLAVFNAAYPDITVNIVRESTGVITARLLAEKDNPQADLIWGTAASSMMVLDDQGMLEPYAPAGVDRILPEFKSDKSVPTWVGIDAWETAFIVNTVKLEELGLSASDIKSYEDLLRPELKGQIVMSNPNSSGTGFLTVAGLLQLKGKDSEEGWNYLDKLHENVDQYVHSGSKPAKMAAAGETTLGVSFGYAGISQKADGAPVEIIFPEEGSGWDLEANALMKKSEINPLSHTFLDWAISDEAMALYKVNYPIIATGGDGTYEGYESDPVEQLIDNDFVWTAQNRDSILTKWMEKFDAKSAAE
jgi:iron(III) transport system substrate-binding protein